MSRSFTERCTVVITWADLYQGLFPAGWSSTHSAPCKAPSPTGVGRGDMAATALTHGTEVSDLPTAARLCALEPWLCPSALPHWHVPSSTALAAPGAIGATLTLRAGPWLQPWPLPGSVETQALRPQPSPTQPCCLGPHRPTRSPGDWCAHYLVLAEQWLLREEREGQGRAVPRRTVHYSAQDRILEIGI